MIYMLPLMLLSIFSRFSRKTEQSDEALMLRFQKGDESAFEMIISRLEGVLSSFIYNKVRDHNMTQDLLQEVFIRMIKHAQSYDHSAKLKTWAFTIAQNLCIDELRKKKRKIVSIDQNIFDDSEISLLDTIKSDELSPLDQVLHQDLKGAVYLALDGLNEDQKEVFLMREERGLKFHEIASILDISENTVKSRMRYALEYLREKLDHFNDISKEEI
jgi:RNA polymerase sigma-70 factor (ECF subfamily)